MNITKKCKQTAIAIGTGLALLASSVVFAMPAPNEDGRGFMRSVFASLDLTYAQKQQLQSLHRAGSKFAKDSGMRELIGLALTTNLDTQQLSVSLDAKLAQRKAQGLAKAQRHFAIRSILTDEQVTQLEQALDAHEGKAKKERDPAKMLSKLNLTDEQSQSAEQHLNTAQAAMQEMQTLQDEFKQYEQGLMQAESFNADAWLNQYELHAMAVKTTATAHITAINSVYNTLDESQQRQLRGMLKKRQRNKHERRG